MLTDFPWLHCKYLAFSCETFSKTNFVEFSLPHIFANFLGVQYKRFLIMEPMYFLKLCSWIAIISRFLEFQSSAMLILYKSPKWICPSFTTKTVII